MYVYRQNRPFGPRGRFNMHRGKNETDVIDERALVYLAVLFVCSALAVFSGAARAAATSGFVTASLEGAYWIGNTLAARYRASVEPVNEDEGSDRYAH